ncbi:MAG: lectin-like domain-containing protein [Chloroflexota bacterium]
MFSSFFQRLFKRFVVVVFVVLFLLDSGLPSVRANHAARTDAPQAKIFFPNFTTENSTTLALVGSAEIFADNDSLRLTPLVPVAQSGAAWYNVPLDVSGRFETIFDFRIDPDGADGFAFIIHNDPRESDAIGGGGCGMGYAETNPITNSLVVEFDTFRNNYYCAHLQDPDGNHIGIMTGGASHDPLANNELAVTSGLDTFSDGGIHTVKIHYESKVVSVYLDDLSLTASPVVTAEVDLEATVGAGSAGTAWIGFTAGTGTTAENHEILNWYYISEWDLTCLDFSFYNSSGFFTAEVGGYDDGWQGRGRVRIDRGINYYSSVDLYAAGETFDRQLLTLINGSTEPLIEPRPVQRLSVVYEWLNPPEGGGTLPVNLDYDVKFDGQPTLLEGSQSASIQSGQDPETFTIQASIDNQRKPKGLDVDLSASDSAAWLSIQKVGLCIEAGPQGEDARPPVIPPGAEEACLTLLENIRQGTDSLERTQPFGNGLAQQSEFQFPADVTLEPYFEFSFTGDETYPPLMQYAGSVMGRRAVIPCAYKQNGQLYNPAYPGIPIVRFAVLGPDDTATTHTNEWLSLLNYAGYFTVGPREWCYPGDDAFPTYARDSQNPDAYGPGYNVPSPKVPCDQLNPPYLSSAAGPCGSFVGSLYRAMGYFNVQAFADAYEEEGVMSVIGNLYYGPYGFNTALPGNRYAPVNQPVVRVDFSDPAVYAKQENVSFTQLRLWTLRDGQRVVSPYTIDPVNCNEDAEPECAPARAFLNGVWYSKDFEKEIVRNANGMTEEQAWQQIKPGDIAITWLASSAGMEYTHIAVVVGWGRFPHTVNARFGDDFYPTYAEIPADQRADFVPYVMDRFTRQGYAEEPRPFHHGIWHSAHDIWIASYPTVPTAQASPAQSGSTASSGTSLAATAAMTMPVGLQMPDTDASAAWSPDGKWIALGGQFGARLYTPELTPTVQLAGVTGAVTDLAWSQDGQKLAGALAAQRVLIWDPQTGNRLAQLDLAGNLLSVAWGPAYLATSAEGGVSLWNANTLQVVRTLPYTGTVGIQSLAWSHAGDRLAGSDGEGIYVWDASSGLLSRYIALENAAGSSVAWLPGDESILTPGPHRWELATGKEAGVYHTCSSGTDRLVAISPDGQWLAGAGSALSGMGACTQRLDGAGNAALQSFLNTYSEFETVTAMAWQPGGQRLAVATQSGWLSLWDGASGELLRTVPRPGTTTTELTRTVSACVYQNRRLDFQMTQQILGGNFSALQTTAQDRAGVLMPGCSAQLATTGAYFMQNPPPVEPQSWTWQPLTLSGLCTKAPGETLNWRVTNPNPYDVLVKWSWQGGDPESGYQLAVPATQNGVTGQWTFSVPAQPSTGTLVIASGSFTATATSNLTICSENVFLPLVQR